MVSPLRRDPQCRVFGLTVFRFSRASGNSCAPISEGDGSERFVRDDITGNAGQCGSISRKRFPRVVRPGEPRDGTVYYEILILPNIAGVLEWMIRARPIPRPSEPVGIGTGTICPAGSPATETGAPSFCTWPRSRAL